MPIETSDQPRARHDFNLRGAGLSTRPGVSRAAASAHGQPFPPLSVVSSCQRHGHDPFAYLRDVLECLPTLPKERVSERLPDRWSPIKPADAAGERVLPKVTGHE
jgi:hypothetical protein